MSVYIYLFRERVIYWTPQTMFSKPVNIGKVNWYSITGAIPMPLNDMIARANVSYSLQKGFFTLNEELPPDWGERDGIIKKIQIMGAFHSISNTQRLRYTDNSMGQSLADLLLLDEITTFRKTKNLAECTILTSLIETSEKGLTPEALVTKLWLQYESYRTTLAYLNRLEFNLRQLLEVNDFDKANEVINSELEKMRV